MFAEVKAMLPISGDGYDQEIITQIKAAALDLTTSAEIVLPGVIIISKEGQTVTDNSTLTDELVITAIATWCNMRIGNPPNYDNLRAAYNAHKGHMRTSSKYKGGTEDAEAVHPAKPQWNAHAHAVRPGFLSGLRSAL